MTTFRPSHPFAARPAQFEGVRVHGDWRLKRYAIAEPSQTFAPDRFAGGEALALAALPSPAEAAGRPGVGILILHQGAGMDYTVLAWWDRENELPLRVWVDDGAGWRPAAGSESICVWDLEVIWNERQAYVEYVLSRPDAPDIEAYLATRADQA